MGLQLVLGGSGFGKSHYIYTQVIEKSLAHPEKNYFIVVPEQYTMQVQKNIVRMHPDHGTMNIDVVSFGRLAYRIFDELGLDTLTVLDDIGKSMVVRRIVDRELSKLKVFQGNAGKAGFISEMKSTISELLQYHISPENLKTAAAEIKGKPALTGKLADIEKIYSGFIDYISEKYITTEEILDRLVNVIQKSALVRRSAFYFDEFTGFTPSQYDLLCEILKMSLDVQVALTVDTREDVYKPGKPYELFYLTKSTIHRLNRCCMESGAQREEDIVLPYVNRFPKGSPLSVIERQIYRSGSCYEKRDISKSEDADFKSHEHCKNTAVTAKNDGRLEIYVMHNPSEELDFITQEILKLCREGIRYREIALVTGDLVSYGHIVENAMRQAEIPFFIDQKKDVLSNGFVEFIRALIDVIVQDFSYNSVFRYLKTGWTDIEMADIDRLDNYVLATGIRGYRMWSKPFVRRYKGLAKDELSYMNQVRSDVMSWLSPVKEAFSEQPKTAGQYSRAVMDFLVSHEMAARVEKKSQWFASQNLLSAAKEYQQIYRVVEDIFKRMDEILEEEPMSVRSYKDILDAGLNEAKVGIIPPGADQVMIGDILRTRLDHVSVLFFIGVNEGVVPRTIKDGGLINDRDKEVLKSCSFELAPTGKEDAYTEKFYIYSMLSKPSKRLVMTYTKVDSSSRSMHPSTLIGRIQKILPEINVTDTEMLNEQEHGSHIYSISAVRKYLTRGLGNSKEVRLPKAWFELYLWMSGNDDTKAYSKMMMDMAFGKYEDTPLSKAAVRALYGSVLEGSVTMLEKYASCAYAHFLAYGLNLNERQEYHLSAPDLGILFHSVIELFSKRLDQSEYNWHTIPDEERRRLAKKCVADVVADEKNLVLMDNFRNQFMIQRLSRMVQKTLWALQKQIQHGSFEPEDYELRFDSSHDHGPLDLKLSENEVLKLAGAIDRLDLYEDDHQMYVRIIDYKSGTKKFDMTALFYGLQLQLVVYMETAMELKSVQAGGRHVIPAGILYYNINDPMISVDSASVYGSSGDDGQPSKEEVDHEVLKMLKMNGLVNSNMDIIKFMDAHMNGASDILPVSVNKDGSLSKSSSTASTERFHTLFSFTEDKVKSIGKEIMKGNIGVHPYDRGSRGHGCSYCPYRAVCGFDEDLEGFESRRIKEMSKDDIWRLMEEKENERELDRRTEKGH